MEGITPLARLMKVMVQKTEPRADINLSREEKHRTPPNARFVAELIALGADPRLKVSKKLVKEFGRVLENGQSSLV